MVAHHLLLLLALAHPELLQVFAGKSDPKESTRSGSCQHICFSPCLFTSLDVEDVFALDPAQGVHLLSDAFPNAEALSFKSLITCLPWP